MPTSDPLDILLAHNRWANRNLLEACAALTTEQFHQPFDIGPGSLHDTTAHILSAMAGWTDDLVGRPVANRLGATRWTAPQLLDLMAVIDAELGAAATARPLDERVTTTFDSGATHTFTRGAVLTHVLTHSMHHRAQCLSMLRHLGVDPLPLSAVDDWSLVADAAE